MSTIRINKTRNGKETINALLEIQNNLYYGTKILQNDRYYETYGVVFTNPQGIN